MRTTRLPVLMAATIIAGAALTGCGGGGSSRWCEFDATDTKVADSFCERGTPGYEWEPDSDGPSKKHKKYKNYKTTKAKKTTKPKSFKSKSSR